MSTNNTFSGLDTGGPRDFGPGHRLGAYTLTEALGRGGMGQVWKATDGKRAVAIKLLPPEFRGNSAAMTQVDEAFQVVHALTHEHICKTLGLFNDELAGPYLVMDFIPGITLSQHQLRGGFPKKRLPLDQVVQILKPVAKALDYAHQKIVRLADDSEHEGVLPRDVKPDNILLVLRDGQPREVWLIDFGLAAEIRNTMTKHTDKAVDTRGTRPYMSPEQIKGKRYQWDGRTDQYSLAVVAYQLLAGHLPFDSDDEFSLMLAISQETPDPIADLPESVNAVILRALSKSKEERFATCQDFVSALTQTPEPVLELERTEVVVEFKRSETTLPDPNVFAGQSAGDAKEFVPGMRFRWCPPGTFTMGTPAVTDNESAVSVTLSQGFWLGETVVTQGQWEALMKSTPWKDKPYVKEGADYPASYISHGDAGDGKLETNSASAFCDLLTEQERKARRLPAGWKYLLPTEAQWEYACRAGTRTTFSFGDNENPLGDYGWFDTNAHSVGESYAHRVGLKQPNGWGLLDMHGNVWEWCQDWYQEKLRGGCDPVIRSRGSYRMSRGGSWRNVAADCRTAFRNTVDPTFRSNFYGFRLALSSGKPRSYGVKKRERKAER